MPAAMLVLHRHIVELVEQVPVAQRSDHAQRLGVRRVLIVELEAPVKRQVIVHVQQQVDRIRLLAGLQCRHHVKIRVCAFRRLICDCRAVRFGTVPAVAAGSRAKICRSEK